MNRRILIVDDDPLNRKLLSDLLVLKGYEVYAANNGENGMKMAYAHRPDLILMDIQMPVMDGFEVVQLLKADPLTCSTAIWVLTSYAMPDDKDRIRTNGCDEYFTKPLDLRDLLVRIERHFENSSLSYSVDAAHPGPLTNE